MGVLHHRPASCLVSPVSQRTPSTLLPMISSGQRPSLVTSGPCKRAPPSVRSTRMARYAARVSASSGARPTSISMKNTSPRAAATSPSPTQDQAARHRPDARDATVLPLIAGLLQPDSVQPAWPVAGQAVTLDPESVVYLSTPPTDR